MLYSVHYKSRVITDNEIILPDKYSCVSFENIGTSQATLNNNIPLTSGQRWFNEKPFVQIDSNFSVSFTGTGTNKVLVIFAYYVEIKD